MSLQRLSNMNNPPMKNKNETTRILRVIYTDSERLELGKKLAEAHNDLAQVNADFDRVKADFKAKTTAHEAQIVDLSNKVSSGYRMESVKCCWVLNAPKLGFKVLLRLDTDPNAIVESAEMTEADKQSELGIDETPALAGIEKDGTVKVEADE